MAVSKNSLANLKPCGKKFSKDYQPDRRKLSLFRMLANIIGEQELDVSFTKEDFYKCYQYIIELNEEQIMHVIADPQTPIWMVSVAKAIVVDAKTGSSQTIEKMFDRLFGRAAQSTDITTGGDKITVVPPKIVFTDDFEDDPDDESGNDELN